MDHCDKQSLMIPMLGLWDGLCRSKHNPIFAQLHEQMSGKLESIFPKDFTYETEKGKAKKELFGNLLQRMAEDHEDELKGDTNATESNSISVLLGVNAGRSQKSPFAGLAR